MTMYNITRILAVALLCMLPDALQAQRAKAVDLGLSVMWADRNVGADSPEEYGCYFAWGEVTPKRYYGSYSSYRHYDDKRFHRYNYLPYKGSTLDNLLCLQPSDDAASRRMRHGWRMPTDAEVRELLDSTRCTITPAMLNGTHGFSIKGRGERCDSIFLPKAGYKDYGARRFFPAVQCRYWTATLLPADSLAATMDMLADTPEAAEKRGRSAVCLTCPADGVLRLDFIDRRVGCVVRAVRSR